jgi:hypothetical protein
LWKVFVGGFLGALDVEEIEIRHGVGHGLSQNGKEKSWNLILGCDTFPFQKRGLQFE